MSTESVGDSEDLLRINRGDENEIDNNNGLRKGCVL